MNHTFAKKITILFICISVLTIKAQFFGLQSRNNFAYSAVINLPKNTKHKVIVSSVVNNCCPSSKIFIYSSSFNLIDSVNFLNGVIPSNSNPLLFNNHFYWNALSYDTLNQSGTSNFCVIETDTNFHFLNIYHLGTNIFGQTCTILNIIKIKNTFFTSYSNSFTNQTRIYKFNSQFSKIDSIYLNYTTNEIQEFNNQLLLSTVGNLTSPCPAKVPNRLKVMVLDTLFNLNTCLSLDSVGFYKPQDVGNYVGLYTFLNITSKAIRISNTKYVAVGAQKLLYKLSDTISPFVISNVIIANNQNIIKLNLFHQNKINNNYFEFANFVDVTQNNITALSTLGNDFQNTFYSNNQRTKIFVSNTDTLGNTKWVKEYGGDFYYRPLSIVSTIDGGYLICGWRYNQNTMTDYNNPEDFLLKLDSNGNYNSVNILENGMAKKNLVKVFPNPTTQQIQFDLPMEYSYSISINGIDGKRLYFKEAYINYSMFDINYLPEGIYFYEIKTANSFYSGKFLKVKE